MDDDYEHIDKEEALAAGSIDDDYEFVEALVAVSRAAPAAALAAKPVCSVGGVDAYEDDEDDDDYKVFLQPGPGIIIGGVASATPSSSQPPCDPLVAEEEKTKTASPIGPPGADAVAHGEALPVLPFDLMVDVTGVADAEFAAPAQDNRVVAAPPSPPRARGTIRCAADVEEDEYDEATDDDEDDDGAYGGYYDFEYHGRSRRVKRSKVRRSGTKKAGTMGRPRGEERSSHIAGNH